MHMDSSTFLWSLHRRGQLGLRLYATQVSSGLAITDTVQGRADINRIHRRIPIQSNMTVKKNPNSTITSGLRLSTICRSRQEKCHCRVGSVDFCRTAFSTLTYYHVLRTNLSVDR